MNSPTQANGSWTSTSNHDSSEQSLLMMAWACDSQMQNPGETAKHLFQFRLPFRYRHRQSKTKSPTTFSSTCCLKKECASAHVRSLACQVRSKHLEVFANELDMKSSYVNELVVETVARLQDSMEETITEFKDRYGDSPILQRVPVIVQRRCKRVLKDSL